MVCVTLKSDDSTARSAQYPGRMSPRSPRPSSAAGTYVVIAVALRRLSPARCTVQRRQSASELAEPASRSDPERTRRPSARTATTPPTGVRYCHRIADQDAPAARLGAKHRDERIDRQMVSVRDEAGRQPRLSQLRPDVVRMAGKQRVHTVAEVRGHPRTRVGSGGDLRRRCAGVPDGREHPPPGDVPNVVSGAPKFRSKRHHAYRTLSGRLPAFALVDAG